MSHTGFNPARIAKTIGTINGGTAIVDFGAFPGKSDASVVVTGQGAILSGSILLAWLYPLATSDHSADEHRVEQIDVYAGNIVAATGFTIWAMSRQDQIAGRHDGGTHLQRHSPGTLRDRLGAGPGVVGRLLTDVVPVIQNRGPRLYGQWTVAWMWI